jgi:hypothetical protein
LILNNWSLKNVWPEYILKTLKNEQE